MASSVYFSKHYEFVDKILRLRKRKRIKVSFLISFFLHILTFIFLSLNLKMHIKENNITFTETYVEFADYKPLEKLHDKVEPFDNKVADDIETSKKIDYKRDIKDINEEDVNIFRRPESFSWRETVSKKYIREESKIVTPKLIELPKKIDKQSKANDLSPQMVGYIKALIITIKSHWQIPEDVYNRLQGYSTELEIYIDENGFLRYKIVKPSISKLFNEYSEDALRKTFSNLPPQLMPPKEFLDYLNNGGKIIIEFKL